MGREQSAGGMAFGAGTLPGDNTGPHVTNSTVLNQLILSFLPALSASSATIMIITNIHVVLNFTCFTEEYYYFCWLSPIFFFLKRN